METRSLGLGTSQRMISVLSGKEAPVTQITDSQIQAPTSVAPVTQISDGQIQALTSVAPVAPVTQITDGQIQAPTSVAPVTQITDGQIQVPTKAASTGVVPPASKGAFTSPAPTAAFTGATAFFSWSQEIVMAAVGAAAGIAMLKNASTINLTNQLLHATTQKIFGGNVRFSI